MGQDAGGMSACNSKLWGCCASEDAAVAAAATAVLLLQVIDVWEPVTESDVQTPLEVYKELQEDGYDVVSSMHDANVVQ
jgi:hypothetical protein